MRKSEKQTRVYGYACFLGKFDDIERQSKAISDYAKTLGYRWMMLVSDKLTKASQRQFIRRPGIRRMEKHISETDHLVVQSFACVMRRPEDWNAVSHWLALNRVTLHIVDGPTGDPVRLDMIGDYRLVESFLAGLSYKFERVATPTAKPQSMIPLGVKSVQFYPPSGAKPYKRFVWDITTRLLMRRICRMHDDDKMNFADITNELNDQGIIPPGRPYHNKSIKFTCTQIRSLYLAEKTYAYFHISDPNLFSMTKLRQMNIMPDEDILEQLEIDYDAPIRMPPISYLEPT